MLCRMCHWVDLDGLESGSGFLVCDGFFSIYLLRCASSRLTMSIFSYIADCLAVVDQHTGMPSCRIMSPNISLSICVNLLFGMAVLQAEP